MARFLCFHSFSYFFFFRDHILSFMLSAYFLYLTFFNSCVSMFLSFLSFLSFPSFCLCLHLLHLVPYSLPCLFPSHFFPAPTHFSPLVGGSNNQPAVALTEPLQILRANIRNNRLEYDGRVSITVKAKNFVPGLRGAQVRLYAYFLFYLNVIIYLIVQNENCFFFNNFCHYLYFQYYFSLSSSLLLLIFYNALSLNFV